MQNKDDFNKYDNEIRDIDEIEGTDIKINPDFYIHSAIIKSQECLTKDNLKEGLIQYRLIIEQLEVLAKAADMLADNYKDLIENFKQTDEYKDEQLDYVKHALLATKKLEILCTAIFSAKVSTEPLRA